MSPGRRWGGEVVDRRARQRLGVAGGAARRVQAVEGGSSTTEVTRGDRPNEAAGHDWRSDRVFGPLPQRGDGLGRFGIGEGLDAVLARYVERAAGERISAETAGKAAMFLADGMTVDGWRAAFHGRLVDQVADAVLAGLK